MEIYLLETRYPDGEMFCSLVMRVKDTDIWIDDGGHRDGECLDVIQFTKLFWREVDKRNTQLLTKLGTL